MGAGGVGTFRQNLNWFQVEPTPGARNWSGFDAIVRAAAEAHIRVLPTLYGSPRFIASSEIRPPLSSPEAKRAWRRFVRDAVARYGREGTFWQENPSLPPFPIKDWQVWNEESSPSFWYRRVNAKSYAELVRLAHSAAVEADPRARIVLGGLFPHPRREGAMTIYRYLDQLYSVPRAKRWFDAVAVHPYAPDQRQMRKIMFAVRHEMDAHGDPTAGMWITEFGWSSGGSPSPYTRSAQGQRDVLTKAYGVLKRNRADLKLRSAVWFCWRDRPPNVGESDWWGVHSGLFRTDGSAKLAWRAYSTVAGGTQ